jgi:hypothetical protein
VTSSGVDGGTAQKYGRASRFGRSGAGRDSLIVSVLPSTDHDSTSRRYGCAGETSLGERARASVRANASGVTSSPLLNRQPSWTRNEYVSRSRETVGSASATCGSSRVPAPPFRGG